MKKTNKIIAALLVVCMLFSFATTVAFATETEAVATVDGDEYVSLQDAIDNAVAKGSAVELVADVESSAIITIAGALTINGNNHKLTSSAARAINIDTTAEVTINDYEIVGKKGCERGINIINKAGTTNLNGLKVSDVSHYAVHVATSAGAAKVNIDNCDLSSYGAIAIYGSGSTTNVTDSVLKGVNVYTGENSFSTVAAGGKNITINVKGSKIIAESTQDTAKQYIVGAIKNSCENLKIVLDADFEVNGTATIIGYPHEDDYVVYFSESLKSAIVNSGVATKACDIEGMIQPDFDKEVFAVTFVADDKEVYSMLVQQDDKIESLPAVPKKDGFTAAWDYNDKAITEDTTVKAVYTEFADTKEVFEDVKSEGWYKEYVDYAYSHKLLVGMSDKEFGIDEALTRGMFVTVLARIDGVDTGADANKDAKEVFADVKAGEYYSKAVEWAKENNIVAGYEDGTFKATATVSRQELCKMLVNYVEFAKVTLKDDKEAIDFADADKIGDWAKSAVTACQKAGIVVGYEVDSKTYFGPKDTATRAQGSVILAKFHSEYVK